MSNPQYFYIDESKKKWYSTSQVTEKQLVLGCLMRIANSLEIISKEKIFEQLKWNTERKESLLQENRHLNRKISSLKGVVTKLRRKLK